MSTKLEGNSAPTHQNITAPVTKDSTSADAKKTVLTGAIAKDIGKDRDTLQKTQNTAQGNAVFTVHDGIADGNKDNRQTADKSKAVEQFASGKADTKNSTDVKTTSDTIGGKDTVLSGIADGNKDNRQAADKSKAQQQSIEGQSADGDTTAQVADGMPQSAEHSAPVFAEDGQLLAQIQQRNPDIAKSYIREYIDKNTKEVFTELFGEGEGAFSAEQFLPVFELFKENPHFMQAVKADENIKTDIITSYLNSLMSSSTAAPRTVPGSAHSGTFALSAPVRPRTIKEAGDIAQKMIKLL